MRSMSVVLVRLEPARDTEFAEIVRMVSAPYEKINSDQPLVLSRGLRCTARQSILLAHDFAQSHRRCRSARPCDARGYGRRKRHEDAEDLRGSHRRRRSGFWTPKPPKPAAPPPASPGPPAASSPSPQ